MWATMQKYPSSLSDGIEVDRSFTERNEFSRIGYILFYFVGAGSETSIVVTFQWQLLE